MDTSIQSILQIILLNYFIFYTASATSTPTPFPPPRISSSQLSPRSSNTPINNNNNNNNDEYEFVKELSVDDYTWGDWVDLSWKDKNGKIQHQDQDSEDEHDINHPHSQFDATASWFEKLESDFHQDLSSIGSEGRSYQQSNSRPSRQIQLPVSTTTTTNANLADSILSTGATPKHPQRQSTSSNTTPPSSLQLSFGDVFGQSSSHSTESSAQRQLQPPLQKEIDLLTRLSLEKPTSVPIPIKRPSNNNKPYDRRRLSKRSRIASPASAPFYRPLRIPMDLPFETNSIASTNTTSPSKLIIEWECPHRSRQHASCFGCCDACDEMSNESGVKTYKSSLLPITRLYPSINITFPIDNLKSQQESIASSSSSSSPKKTVHKLVPSDISAVLGIGDSLMSGFNMHHLRITDLTRRKYLQTVDKTGIFTNGAGEDLLTLHNLFNQYRESQNLPPLIGGSYGYHSMEYCQDEPCNDVKYYPKIDGLVGAVTSGHLYHTKKQIDYLVWRLRQYGRQRAGLPTNKRSTPRASPKVFNESEHQLERTYIDNEWKLVVFWLGVNDISVSCEQSHNISYITTWFEHHLRHSIESIHERMPKTILNMLGYPDLLQLLEVDKFSSWCKFNRRHLTNFMSPCAFGVQNRTQNHAFITNLTKSVNTLMKSLVNEYQIKYRHDDNFAIIYDPGATSMNFAQVGPVAKQFLSRADCFHPNVYGQQMIALNVWNNLFKTSSEKASSYDFSQNAKLYWPGLDEKIRVE